MVVPASLSPAEPVSLAVLARSYGASAPAVVELIRRTGGCTSDWKVSRSQSRQAPDQSWLGGRRESRLRASCSLPVATDASRGVRPARNGIAVTPTSSSRPGWRVTRVEALRRRSPRTRSCSRRSPHPRSGRSIEGSRTLFVSGPAGQVARPMSANTASRCAAWSAMPRAILGSARPSARTATATKPRRYGTRT